MRSSYIAAIQRDGPWWIGWCLKMNRADSTRLRSKKLDLESRSLCQRTPDAEGKTAVYLRED